MSNISKDFVTKNGVIIKGTNIVTSSTSQTNALQVDGGAAIAKNLIVGSTATIYGQTTIVNTANSFSTTTGALQVAGGIGVAGNGYFGGTITAASFVGPIAGTSTQVTTVQQTSAGTHFLTFVDSNNLSATAETIYTSATVTVNPGTLLAISTTTGALQIVNAGIGVGGSVYVQNRVGFVNNSNVSVVYQIYNPSTNSLDTVFA